MTGSEGWLTADLGSVATFQRGFDITKAAQTDGPYPVISSSGPASSHAEYKVEGPGVVIGRKGSLGGVYYASGPYWPHDTTLWVKDFHGNDPRFVYYFLQTLGLAQYDVGAANPTLNRNHIHLLPVRIPPLQTQRKIASILSDYDDLIETNSRRIKLLEETALRIYREWFVHFRCPGHAPVALVESESDPIPDGWAWSTVGDVAVNFDRMRKPLSGIERAKRPGAIPYYGAAKVFDFIDDYLFDGTYLLVAEDGSVMTPEGLPVLQYVSGKFWANNHTHILQGRRTSTEYLYLVLRNQPISGFVTGAAQPKITQRNLNRIPCLLAPASVHQALDEAVQPMFTLGQNLLQTNFKLLATRDVLLRRILSGDIAVDDLNIQGTA